MLVIYNYDDNKFEVSKPNISYNTSYRQVIQNLICLFMGQMYTVNSE
jgi:hypothetical protein